MSEQKRARKARSVAFRVGNVCAEANLSAASAEATLTLRLESNQIYLVVKNYKLPPLQGLGAVERITADIRSKLADFCGEVIRMTHADTGVFAFQRKDVNEKIAKYIAIEVDEASLFFDERVVRSLYFGWMADEKEAE